MNILDVLYPVKCPICDRILENGDVGFCKKCYKHLPYVVEPFCKHCGKPLKSENDEYCVDCIKRESHFKEGVALWLYDDRMRKAMADLKYGGCRFDAGIYAKELAEAFFDNILRWKIDYIVPVPVHFRRKWFRGYNQAGLVAKELSRLVDIPYIGEALIRKKHTKPQKELDNKERHRNLLAAIEFNEKIDRVIFEGKNILLIDDIYTTGATLETCSEILLQVGIKNVYTMCLCVGRGFV